MNHKNEIPANGTKFNANRIVFAWLSNSSVDPNGFAGTAVRISKWLPMVKEEKRIPARAAARGIFSFRRSSSVRPITARIYIDLAAQEALNFK
jgi:hypothetical protein